MTQTDAQADLTLDSLYFRKDLPAKCCIICGRDAGLPEGQQPCPKCAARVLAITLPARREQRRVEQLLRSERTPAILRAALHNATGDWRRAAIRRRMKSVGAS